MNILKQNRIGNQDESTAVRLSGMRLAAFLLTVLMLLPLLAPSKIHAVAGYESEDNDTIDTADNLSVNSKIIGNISSTNWDIDEDYFKVEILNNGYVEIDLEHDLLSSGQWNVNFYSFQNELKSVYSFEAYGNEASSRSIRLAVEPGTYYVMVKSYSSAVKGVTYTLSVNFTATEYWEALFNGEFTNAKVIQPDTQYSGNISSTDSFYGGDEDYFKVEILNNGYVEIDLEHDLLSSGQWNVNFYSFQNELKSVYSFEAYGNEASSRSIRLAVEPGTYYVMVKSYSSAVKGVTYTLSVNFTATEYWEALFNGEFTNAKVIQPDTQYSGNISSTDSFYEGDEDYFKVEILNNGYIELRLDHTMLKSGSWQLTFYRFSNQLEQIYRFDAEAAESVSVSERLSVEPGTYYVMIKSYSNAVEGVTYTLSVNSVLPFTDVPSDSWYTPYVSFAVRHALFNGTSSTTFSPDMAMSRAMFVQLFANLDGVNLSGYTSTPFSDAPLSSWYGPAVAWAAQNGVVNGTSPTTFAPDDEITREQMCVLIVNYAEYKGISLNETKTVTFSDAADISGWARDAVEVCANAGIINGAGDGTFNPSGTASRAEVATLMTNFCRIVLGMQ